METRAPSSLLVGQGTNSGGSHTEIARTICLSNVDATERFVGTRRSFGEAVTVRTDMAVALPIKSICPKLFTLIYFLVLLAIRERL